jgi:hypothetical protein
MSTMMQLTRKQEFADAFLCWKLRNLRVFFIAERDRRLAKSFSDHDLAPASSIEKSPTATHIVPLAFSRKKM